MKRNLLFGTFIVGFIILSLNSYAASRYWVGGAGAWSDPSHWSNISGGSGGSSVPTVNDDVFIDDNSFSASNVGMITLKNSVYCNDVLWSASQVGAGITGKSSVKWYIAGSLNFQNQLTNNFSGDIIFTSSGAETIGSVVAFNSNLIFNSTANGSWSILSAITTSKTIELLQGNISINHKVVEAKEFLTSGTQQRGLSYIDSKLRITEKWTIDSKENLSFNSENSTLVFLGDIKRDFDYASLVYNLIVTSEDRAPNYTTDYDYYNCQVLVNGIVTGTTGDYKYVVRDFTTGNPIYNSGQVASSNYTFPNTDTVSSGKQYYVDFYTQGNMTQVKATLTTVVFPDYPFAVKVTVEKYESCFGAMDFELRVDPVTDSLGTPGYTYSWDPTSPVKTTQIVGSLGAYNNYTCYVTDLKNCTQSGSLLYFPPWAPDPYPGPYQIVSSETVVNTCQGSSTGSITISPKYDKNGNGVYDALLDLNGTFEVSLDNGIVYPYQSSKTFSGLAAGTYPIWVRDNDPDICKFNTHSVTIASTPAPTASAGSAGTICENQTFSVTTATATNYSSIVWSAVPDGSFSSGSTLATVYTPGPLAKAAGSATIRLTANGNGSCASVFSEAIVTITKLPTANAGGNSNVCEGNTYTFTTASATNYSSIKWTTSGNGTFSNDAVILPVYTPGTNDITNGTVTLTLTAYGNGSCTNATSNMVLTIIKAPIANTGGNASICKTSTYTFSTATATNGSSILWTTAGDGTFNFNNIAKPIYTPGNNDKTAGSVNITMRVNGNAPCSFDTDVMTLTLQTPPTVDAGSNVSICVGSTASITTATGANYSSLSWASSGDGTFSGGTTLSPTYTLGAADITAANTAGSITRTLTITAFSGGACANVTDNMTLNIQAAPTAYAGTNKTICETGTLSLTEAAVTRQSSILWSSSGTGSFSNTTVQNPVYTPSALDKTNGSVTLTITAFGIGVCGSTQSSMVLTIDQTPVIEAGNAISVCQNSTVTVSDATASKYSTLTWTSSGRAGALSNASTISPTYTHAAPDAGSVTLTLTATSLGVCPNTTDTKTVTIVPAPTANAGLASTICETGTLSISGASATNYSSIVWSRTGDGTFSNSSIINPVYTPGTGDIAAATTTRILTLTANGNAPCTSVTSTRTVTIQSLPIVDAGNAGSVCEGNAFTVTTATASEYSTLNWTSSGDGTFTAGTQTTLGAVYTPGPNDIVAGTVTLTLTANGKSSCGSASDNMTLTVMPSAIANAGLDGEICQNETHLCADATAQNQSSVSWTHNGSGSFDNSLLLNATYFPVAADAGKTVVLTLTANSALGCANDIDTKNLIIRAIPVVSAGSDQTICETGTVVLSTATASNYASLSWATSGDGSFSPVGTLNPTYTPGINDKNNATQTITLTLTAVGQATCPSVNSQMSLTIESSPTVNSGGNMTICETSTFKPTTAAASDYSSLLWTSSGNGTFDDASLLVPEYTPGSADLTTGTVNLTLTAYGNIPCANASSSLTLTLAPSPTVDAGNVSSTCYGEALPIVGATASDYNSLAWSTSGDGTFAFGVNALDNPVYTPGTSDLSNGNVTLTLTAFGNAPCNQITDNINVVFSPKLDVAIGAPTPFLIQASTKISVCITADHTMVQQLGFHLVSPSGLVLDLETSPSVAGNPSPPCNFGDNIDNMCFTTEAATPLNMCVNPPFPPAPALTGSYLPEDGWTALYGLDPAQGGWAVQIRDYIPGNTGILKNATISFTDLDSEGKLTTVSFNSGTIAEPIKDPSGVGFKITTYRVPMGLRTTCFGSCDATAIVTPIGGTPPYASYNWNDPVIPDLAQVDLCAGTFTVTVTDANGCSSTGSVTVTQPNKILSNILLDNNVLCKGECDAAAHVTPTQGIVPYSYQWTSSETVASATALCVGWNYVTITDANTCEVIDSVNITEPATEITLAATIDSTSCFNTSDGAISVVASGGTLTTWLDYQYNWSNGATTSNISGLAPGVYTITVTDENGCEKIVAYSVYAPNQLVASASLTKGVSCFGGNDGIISASQVGGTPTYTYLWDDVSASTTPSVSGLPQGTYTVIVTDGSGCSDDATITVTQPTVITTSILPALPQGLNVSCFGLCDATVVASPSGGTPPYSSYSWSNPSLPNSNIVSLCGGKSYVTITDNAGCQKIDSVTIGEPLQITTVISSNDILCKGDASGDATVTASNGFAPYSYKWSDALSQTTQTASGLVAGQYIVNVTDNNLCAVNDTIVINQPNTAIGISASVTNTLCSTSSNGSIALTVNGGTLPTWPDYLYSWSNGATTSSISNIIAGSYTVTVTDENSCENDTTIIVSSPSALTVSIINKVDVLCFNQSTGTAEASVLGGSPGYTYLWNDASAQITAKAVNLKAGTYTVTVTDINGCTQTAQTTLTQPAEFSASIGAPSPFTISASTNIQVCFSATHTMVQQLGFQLVSPSGVRIDLLTSPSVAGNPSPPCNFGDDIDNLCFSTGAATPLNMCVNPPFPPSPALSGTYASEDSWSPFYGLNPAQGGWALEIRDYIPGSTGAITSATISFSDLNGEGNMETVLFESGVVNIPIKDAVTSYKSTVYRVPMGLSTSCFGVCDARAIVTPIGGKAPYVSYIWSDSNLPHSSSVDLCAGVYTVTVTDIDGCKATTTTTVTEPDKILTTVSGTDAICFESTSGTAMVVATDGVIPYSYAWDNGILTDNVSNLDAGQHYVTVTDKNGCEVVDSIVINQPAAISIVLNATPVTCNGDTDGTIKANVSGGTLTSPDYSYLWSTLAVTDSIFGLSVGNYSVTVSDDNGCEDSASTAVITPNPLIADSLSVTDASCNGVKDGSAQISVSGGTSPYSYLWNDPAASTSMDLTGVGAGVYIVNVTDSKLCTDNAQVTISEPSAMSLAYTLFDGTVINTSGGVSDPYPYLISATTDIEVCLSGTHNMIEEIGFTLISPTGIRFTQLDAPVKSSAPLSCNVGSNFTNLCFTMNAAQALDVCSLIPSDPTLTGDWKPATVYAPLYGTDPTTEGWKIEIEDCGMFGDGILTSASLTFTDNNGSGIPTQVIRTSGVISIPINDGAGVCTQTIYTLPNTSYTPPAVSASMSVSCFGAHDQEIMVVATGGTLPYASYMWSDPLVIGSDSVLIGGGKTYLSVTDANNCVITDSLIVDQPAQLVLSFTTANAACFGSNTAAASVIVSGGVSPYNYLWENGSTNDTISGISAGWYTVTITDNNGCSKVDSVLVTEPTQITITETGSTPSACTSATGSAWVKASGGTGSYSYSWSNGGSTDIISNVSVNIYLVTITDQNLCSVDTLVQVTDTSSLTSYILAADTSVSCIGRNDGAAQVFAKGGTQPYTFNWSEGSSSASISNLAAGMYLVTVTDVNLCSSVSSVNITEDSVLQVVENVSMISCNGLTDGAASVTAMYGSPVYTYAWDSGSLLNVITNLSQGTYTYTVTDVSGCQVLGSISINEPSLISVTKTVISNVVCTGTCDGSAQILANPLSGTAPFSYAWANGELNSTATSLCEGYNYITITDANSCTHFDSIQIIAPNPPISMLFDTTSSSCGIADGSVSVVVSGAVAPYSYLWSTGDTNPQAQNLFAGIYSLTVTDANLCEFVQNVTIDDTSSMSVDSLIIQNVSCIPCSGQAEVFTSGGTKPYTYDWSNNNKDNVAENLCVGDYFVTITDDNSCSRVAAASIIIDNPVSISFSGVADPSCQGMSNGTAGVMVTGGTGNYSYLWSSGETASTASALSAGYNYITVTDGICTVVDSILLDQPELIDVSLTVNDAKCFNEASGSITTTINNTIVPDSFLWSDGQTTPTAMNLISGIYTVTITYNGACEFSKGEIVGQPSRINYSINSISPSCGADDGEARIVVSGGVAPYTLNWKLAAMPDSIIVDNTNDTIKNIGVDVYFVQITDSNSCVINTNDYTLLDSSNLQANSLQLKHITCIGRADGRAEIEPQSTNPPFIYKWWSATNDEILTNISTTATTGIADSLGVGEYKVYFENSLNCSGVVVFEINDNFVLTSSFIDTIATSCFNGNDGSVRAIGINGTPYKTSPEYRYAWSNGANTANAVGLSPIKYFVTITDSSMCKVVDSIIIPQPLQLVAKFAVDTIKTNCYSSTLDALTIPVIGGTAPYSYLWSDGQTDSIAVNLPAGKVYVTVTDANNCTPVIDSVFIDQGGVFSMNFDTTFTNCGDSIGSAKAIITGGVAPYSYKWSTGQTVDSIGGLWVDYYGVTVTDVNGCAIIDTVEIRDTSSIDFSISIIENIKCLGYPIGKAKINAISGGFSPYTQLWSNGDTRLTADSLRAGIFHVKVYDQNQCTGLNRNSISTDSVLRISEEFKVDDDISCTIIGNGTAEVTVLGGKAPYNYSWSNGDTLVRADSLKYGWYYVTVTDQNACVVSDSIEIANDQLRIDVVSTINASCNGYNDGYIKVRGLGGLGGYIYSWSNGETTSSIDSLVAGTYIVTLTSSFNSCRDVDTIVITQPAGVTPVFTVVNYPGCNDSTGVLSINVSGGNRPYMYSWSTGDNDTLLQNLWAGYFTLSITDAKSCVKDTTYRLTDGTPFAIAPGERKNIRCFGTPTGELTIEATMGVEPYKYTWSHDATLDSDIANGLLNDQYSVTVTDADNCWRDYTFDPLVEPEQLIIEFDTSYQIQCNGEEGEIIAHVTGGNGNNGFNWIVAGDTIVDDSVFSSARSAYYKLIVTDVKGCEARDSIFYLEPAPIDADYTFTRPGCFTRANEGKIEIISITGPGGSFRFNWDNEQNTTWFNTATNKVRSPLTQGSYSFTIYDSLGTCSKAYNIVLNPLTIDSILYSVQLPKCDFYTDEQITANLPDGSINITSVFGGVPAGELAEYNYQWAHLSIGVGNAPLASQLNQGTYTVEITAPSECKKIFEFDTLKYSKVYFTPGIISFIDNDKGRDTLCFGDSIQLLEKTSSWFRSGYIPSNPTESYSWSFDPDYSPVNFSNKTSDSPWVTPLTESISDTSIVWMQTSFDGCTSDTSKFILTHFDKLGFKINIVGSFDENDFILNDSVEIASGGTVDLEPNSTPLFVETNQDNEGFVSFKWNTISTIENSADVIKDSIINSMTYQLTGKYNLTVSPKKTIYYIAEATSNKGCVEYDTVIVSVIKDIKIYSGFTPNGDGLNDTWVIPYAKQCPDAHVVVYNRWGNKIFEDDKDYYLSPWDGTRKGKDVPVGTYYYYIDFKDGKGTDIHSGSVTIIR